MNIDTIITAVVSLLALIYPVVIGAVMFGVLHTMVRILKGDQADWIDYKRERKHWDDDDCDTTFKEFKSGVRGGHRRN